MTPNIADIIRQHVTLSVSCIDRLYLHAYMPKLQTSGGLCYFLHDHLGNPIPSPALFRPIHDRFLTAVETFVRQHRIPPVEFKPGQRKDDLVADYRARFTRREGVVVLGTAQEKMRAFKAHKRRTATGSVAFDFSRQAVAVKHFYFYVHDCDWGPAFLKIGTYVPYPVKLCLNGHEWVKQRLHRQRVRFTSSCWPHPLVLGPSSPAEALERQRGGRRVTHNARRNSLYRNSRRSLRSPRLTSRCK
jgi:hypothetical protein